MMKVPRIRFFQFERMTSPRGNLRIAPVCSAFVNVSDSTS